MEETNEINLRNKTWVNQVSTQEMRKLSEEETRWRKQRLRSTVYRCTRRRTRWQNFFLCLEDDDICFFYITYTFPVLRCFYDDLSYSCCMLRNCMLEIQTLLRLCHWQLDNARDMYPWATVNAWRSGSHSSYTSNTLYSFRNGRHFCQTNLSWKYTTITLSIHQITKNSSYLHCFVVTLIFFKAKISS